MQETEPTTPPETPSDPAPERLWTREFIAMVAVRFFASFALNSYTAVMALYAMNEFAAGEGTAGIAAGMFVIGAMVARFFTAKYTEVIGRDRLLKLSSVAFLVTSIPYVISPSALGIGGLVAVRFFHGMANGVMSNTNTVAVSDFMPRSRLGEGLGYYALGTTVSLAVGPMTALALVHSVGYRAFFILGIVLAAACVAVVFTVKVPNVELSADERDALLHRVSLDQFVDLPTLPLALCMFFACLCYSGVTAFLAPYMENLGYPTLASVYFTVYAVLLLVFRPTVGRLEDRHGENFVIYPTMLFMVAAYVLLANVGALGGLWGIVLVAVIMSAGQGSYFTAMQALVMKRASSVRMGVVTSTFFLFVDAGSGLGSAVLGHLVPGIGYGGMYLVCAGVVVCVAVYYFAVHGRKHRR